MAAAGGRGGRVTRGLKAAAGGSRHPPCLRRGTVGGASAASRRAQSGRPRLRSSPPGTGRHLHAQRPVGYKWGGIDDFGGGQLQRHRQMAGRPVSRLDSLGVPRQPKPSVAPCEAAAQEPSSGAARSGRLTVMRRRQSPCPIDPTRPTVPEGNTISKVVTAAARGGASEGYRAGGLRCRT